MRGNNTLAEGSGSFVNNGKHGVKVFTCYDVLKHIHILESTSAIS